jgi:hypothetical protein
MMKTLLIGRERVSCGNETMGAIQTMYNVRLLGTNTMNAYDEKIRPFKKSHLHTHIYYSNITVAKTCKWSRCPTTDEFRKYVITHINV